MPTPRRRHRRVNEATLWAAIGAAIVVHATLIGSVSAFGLAFVGEAFTVGGAVATATADPTSSLRTTCSGDVLLATSARAAMCLAPWRDDVDGCGQDVVMSMWMDLSSCQGAGDPVASAQVALIEPRQTEQLKAIDPEPLLEEFAKQKEEEQQALAVPPLQPQQPPPPPPPAPPPPPPPPPRPAQVVEVAKPTTEQAPDNARFLAEHDVVVDKQRVARGSVNEPMVAKSKPEDLVAKADPREASMKEPPKQDPGKEPRAAELPGKLAMRAPGTPAPSEVPQQATTHGSVAGERGPLVADGFVPRHGDGAIEQQKRDPGELSRGQGGAGGGTPQVPNLKPTPETLERALGGGSVDHLEDVESGDETALSAKRWVYASFFNRLKRQVAQNWDPASVWRRTDPTGTVHGFKTRITEVRVTLSGGGNLSKIVVTTPSGVGELDNEAVRAFHAAAPFPNPPDGLASKEGLITFQFSFYFEIGAPRTSWRVIRSM